MKQIRTTASWFNILYHEIPSYIYMKYQRGNSLRYFKFCVRREFLFTNHNFGSHCLFTAALPWTKEWWSKQAVSQQHGLITPFLSLFFKSFASMLQIAIPQSNLADSLSKNRPISITVETRQRTIRFDSALLCQEVINFIY